MFWRNLFGALAAIAIIIAVPVVLLLCNLYVLTTPAFLRIEYARLGFTDAEKLRQAEASLAYLRSPEGIEALQRLRNGDVPLYNVRELVHMADVKVVMHWAFVAFWVALGVLGLGAFYVLLRSDLRGRLPVYIFVGCLLLLAFLAAIGAWALLDFNSFFFAFHRLFFVGDSWLFEETDSLIRLFPLQFWIDATLTWALLATAEAVIVAAAAYLWPGWKHR